MFLFALTTSPIQIAFDGNLARKSLENELFLTVLYDGFLSYFEDGDDLLSVKESILPANRISSDDTVLSEIVYKKSDNSIRVRKPTISGRPIYYYLDNHRNFYCSTHIKLLRNAEVPIEENSDALPEFFVYRFVQPPRSMFKDIYQVDLGETIVFDVSSQGVELESSIKYMPPILQSHHNEQATHGTVRQVLSNSIAPLDSKHLRLSILLSGGLDSSILFKLLNLQCGLNESHSTSYPFEDPESDTEKAYAFSAAEAFGSNHHYTKLSIEEYLFNFLEAIQFAEEPIHHLQSVPFYVLFKNSLSPGVNVIVSGEGADSNFGASTHNTLRRSNNLKQHFPWRVLSHLPALYSIPRIVGKGGGLVKALNMINTNWFPISEPKSPLWNIQKYGDREWVCNYFGIDPIDVVRSRYEVLKPFEERPIEDIIALRALFSTQVTQSIWSKVAESQGKKIYYPYYSQDLLDFVYSVPWEIKNRERKYVLRKVAEEIQVPEFIIRRPKSGMGLHPKQWAIPGAGLDPLIPLAAEATDERLIRQFQSQNLHSAMMYWNFLNYGIWKRLIINHESLGTLKGELHEELNKHYES